TFSCTSTRPAGRLRRGGGVLKPRKLSNPAGRPIFFVWRGRVGAGLFLRGGRGKGFSPPTSPILSPHPPLVGPLAPRPGIDIAAREILRMRERINEILVHHTGQPVKRIQDDTERDYIMSADQGKEYGIIDDVIRKRA